jgi:hypothetical protein
MMSAATGLPIKIDVHTAQRLQTICGAVFSV